MKNKGSLATVHDIGSARANSISVGDALPAVIDAIPIAVAVISRDPDGDLAVISSNIAFQNLERLVDSTHQSTKLLENETLTELLDGIDPAAQDRVETRFQTDDPVDPRQLDVTLSSLPTTDDDTPQYLLSLVDRTAELQIQRNLHNEMLSDSLTGLYNRTGFEEAVDERIENLVTSRAGDEKEWFFGVLAIDLSRFRQVNECAGAIVGDELIITVASRLRGVLRTRDILARLGGDEFGIFVELGRTPEDLDRVIKRINSVFETPYSLSGLEVNVEAAIGVGRGTLADANTSDTIRQAQIALKTAKLSGRVEVYRREVLEHARHRFSIETDLRKALARDDLELAFQPLIDLNTNKVVSFEALARWNDKDRGIVSPTDFIPIAEDCGLIVPLGRWALKEAAETLAQWDEIAGEQQDIKVNVNLSAVQFIRDDVAAAVADAIKATSLSGKRLTLELTESVIISDPERAARVMEALKSLNTCLAMDDFGTGYSNLAYLQSLPIDILKIDRSFVTGMLNDKDKVSIVRAVLSLASALGMETTAEGIETLELSNTLAALGCSHGQGYYYAKPLNKEQAFEFLKNSQDQKFIDRDPQS